MAGNTIGKLYTLTSFGESHGKAIGGVVDGCPAGVRLSVEAIQQELDRSSARSIGPDDRTERTGSVRDPFGDLGRGHDGDAYRLFSS